MRKYVRRIVGVLCVLGLLFSGGNLVAYAMTETSVTNHFRTGVVHIELSEYELKDGREVPYESGKEVMPGKKLSEIPRITNRGNDCYVRAKLWFSGTNALSDEDLYGYPAGWTKAADGYWYYRDVLAKGDSVDVCEGLKIPTDFPQEEAGKNFRLMVSAEAIQSKNLTPDFNSGTPWGSVKIQKLSKDGNYEISNVKKEGTKMLQVVYQKDAKKLITNQKDFFVNIPELLPGDSFSDIAALSNHSDKEMKLYFRSEVAEESKLLGKTKIKIISTIGGKQQTVYEGTLADSQMKQDLVLGTIAKESSGYLRFEISLPKDVDNAYILETSAIRWIFSTEPIVTVTPPTKPPTVRTGDKAPIGTYLLVMILCLTIAIGLLLGIEPRIILSGSMEPALKTGSVCFLKKSSRYSDVKEGDIIAYHLGEDTLVIHRAAAIYPEGIETKGDANEVSDGIAVTEKNFAGKVLFSIPALGYGIVSLRQHWGILLGGGAACMAIDIMREKKKL